MFIDFHTATIVSKSVHNLAPSYMRDMIKFSRDVSIRQTRSVSRNDFLLPSGKHEYMYIKSFAYSVAQLLNKLCPTVRRKSSLDSFKHA